MDEGGSRAANTVFPAPPPVDPHTSITPVTPHPHTPITPCPPESDLDAPGARSPPAPSLPSPPPSCCETRVSTHKHVFAIDFTTQHNLDYQYLKKCHQTVFPAPSPLPVYPAPDTRVSLTAPPMCAPSTLILQPATFNPQPSTLNAQPATLNPQPAARNPQRSTRNDQPSTLNTQPATRNLQPSTLNPQTPYTIHATP